MRILFLTLHLRQGGAENHMANLVRYWPNPGDTLWVVSLWGEGELNSKLQSQVKIYTLEPATTPGPLLRFFAVPRLVQKLQKVLATLNPDIVVTFLWFPTWIVSQVLRPQTHLVWSVQNDLVDEYQGGSGYLKRWFTRKSVQKVDHFVAISPGIRDQLIRAYGVAPHKIRVIPNSISLREVVNGADEAADIPARAYPLRFAFSGRLHPQKGWDLLLQAVKMVEDDVPAEFCVLGRGPEEKEFIKTVQALGVEKRVFFAGFQRNPYVWYASADALISTSRWEPFGLVIAEAMALGRPVVATPTHGARFMVEHLKNGYLCRDFTPESIAEGIRWIWKVKNAPKWEEVMASARQRAQRFDATRVARMYRIYLQELLKTQGNGDAHG